MKYAKFSALCLGLAVAGFSFGASAEKCYMKCNAQGLTVTNSDNKEVATNQVNQQACGNKAKIEGYCSAANNCKTFTVEKADGKKGTLTCHDPFNFTADSLTFSTKADVGGPSERGGDEQAHDFLN